ncbi:MAG: hypothetical protein HQL57_01035 [Magnetococcales bacterium]|nr:hypothetical protein [Magnetococcales bacterium]
MRELKLVHQENPRFGFSFDYPEGWERFDPTNLDGNKYLTQQIVMLK